MWEFIRFSGRNHLHDCLSLSGFFGNNLFGAFSNSQYPNYCRWCPSQHWCESILRRWMSKNKKTFNISHQCSWNYCRVDHCSISLCSHVHARHGIDCTFYNSFLKENKNLKNHYFNTRRNTVDFHQPGSSDTRGVRERG